MTGTEANRYERQSTPELERELRRLETVAASTDTDEARQRIGAELSEVRFELMKRGQIALGGGCAQ